jgi:hypothetical protein
MSMAGTKLDLAKTDKRYYTALHYPHLVTLPRLQYVAIAGKGAPESAIFAGATAALYKLAYSVKGLCKAAGNDFVVAKLEGLWWVESDRYGLEVPREEWCWRLLIRMPDFITAGQVEEAKRQAIVKNKELDTAVGRVEWTEMQEGTSVQMMHVGPYSTEPETLARMHEFMEVEGFVRNGQHHEIYLSDPRRVQTAAMKTILRQPVKSRG